MGLGLGCLASHQNASPSRVWVVVHVSVSTQDDVFLDLLALSLWVDEGGVLDLCES